METDIELARNLFRFLCPDSDKMVYLVIEGPPKSKARPRFRRDGRVYASENQVADEEALGWRFKDTFREPMTGNLAVGCIFFRPNSQRIDVDNMLKHVMDSANSIAWVDDSQVTAQAGIVEIDKERPRTVVVIGEHVSSLDRAEYGVKTRTCPTCGREFQSKQQNPKFCSRECSSHSRGQNLRAKVPCAWCGNEFKRITVTSRFCSDDCRLASLNEPNKKKEKPVCARCGAKLSKPGYVHCRACWKANAAEINATIVRGDPDPRSEIEVYRIGE